MAEKGGSGGADGGGAAAPASPSPAAFYQSFFVPAMFAPLAAILVERAGVAPGQRVLDVACGTGAATRRAAALAGSGGSVTGLDLRPGMIACAAALPAPQGASIDWRLGDATALDLPDGAFDRVLCQQGLQFFPDRAAALAEMRRVLAPGGRLALALWFGHEHLSVIGALTEAEIRHLGAMGVPREEVVQAFSLGDAAEIGALLRGAGFAEIEIGQVEVMADFPDPDHFVENVETAYAAVAPETMADVATLDRLISAVQADIAPVIAAHTRDGRLRFPMVSHIALAAR